MNLHFYIENNITKDVFVSKLKAFFFITIDIKIELDNTYDYSLTGIKNIVYEFNKYGDYQSFSTEIFLFFHNQYIIDNLKKTDFYASFSLFLESDILTPINITAYDYILLSKEGACFLVEEDGTNEGDGFIFYSKIEITKEKAFEYLLISPSAQ